MEEFESLANLYQRYLDGTCTSEEVDELLDAFGLDNNEAALRQIIASKMHADSDGNEEHYLRIADNVAASLFPEITRRSLTTKKTIKLWPRIAAIASVIAIIVSGIYFINYQKHDRSLEMLSKNDIAPGHVGATLTLASGKKIRLTAVAEGKIANEAGVAISKTLNGELIYEIKSGDSSSAMNTLSTANGETFQLKLPDGSAVWLNSGSSLTYTAGLMKNGKRMVALNGEAYFQVAKDKTHPFIVQTSKQAIEVLGTQFNVSSYHDEAVVATTLIEGSVKIGVGNSHQLIKPGQQAVTTSKDILVQEADVDQITDWKKGDFNLNELNFQDAMRKISRWYDVEVIYDEDVNTDFQTVGWISRSKKLSVVLHSIQSLGRVHFRVEGRKIYVTR